MTADVQIEGLVPLQKKLRLMARWYPKDAERALNRTAQRVATRTRRDTAKELKIQQKKVKRRFLSFKAKRKGNAIQTSAWVGNKVRIKLIDLSRSRVNAKGILSAGGRKVQTFRATMPSGHTGHFVRKSGAKHRKRKDGQWTQLPIMEPSIELGPTAKPHLRRHAQEQWRKYFPVELRRLVRRTNSHMLARR